MGSAMAEVKSIKQQNESLQKVKSDLENQISKSNSTQNGQLENLDKECNTLKTKLGEQEKLIKESKSRCEQLEKKNSESEKKIKESSKIHENQIKELKKQISTLEADLKTAQANASNQVD